MKDEITLEEMKTQNLLSIRGYKPTRESSFLVIDTLFQRILTHRENPSLLRKFSQIPFEPLLAAKYLKDPLLFVLGKQKCQPTDPWQKREKSGHRLQKSKPPAKKAESQEYGFDETTKKE